MAKFLSKDGKFYMREGKLLRPTNILEVPIVTTNLTYNGKSQSPTIYGYDENTMTMGGVTSGTNVGTYQITFTPKSGYEWSDGTSGAKDIYWAISKAAGSLSLSTNSLTIDANSTTASFTVTRAGDGAISASSNNTGVATVSVSGNTVTVTKVGQGSATITVSVAEGTIHTAPASKTCTVTCKVVPILASGKTWYKSAMRSNDITEMQLVDTYTATGSETESWDASAAQDGSVKAYLNGTKLTIAGNGSGKIIANADSSQAFYGFDSVPGITGLDKLDTSNVTNMYQMFSDCWALTSLDLSNFNTSKVTNMGWMFHNCKALTSVDVSSFNTSNVTLMDDMFSQCGVLTSVDLSSFNTSIVRKMYDMFYNCQSLGKIYVSNLWSTASVTSSASMFQFCFSLSGAISYDPSKIDANYANYTSGYLTYKAATRSNGGEISGYTVSK